MDERAPAVAVLPYGVRLGLRPGQIPLDALHWPLGRPYRLATGCLRDLRRDDHLLMYPHKPVHFRPGFGTRARVSLMVVEPRIIHGWHLHRLRRTHRRFFRVLSCDAPFLASIPNGVFLVFGTTWVPDWATRDLTKSRMVSLIASAKRDQPGHLLRHRIVARARAAGLELDALGRGYAPFDEKAEGLAPYRYSVVIENVREENYFSEKLVDALLCDCVPIYWGCPNIARFLPTDAMILCETEDDLFAALGRLSAEDYAARLPALRALKPRAEAYGNLERRAAEALLASL